MPELLSKIKLRFNQASSQTEAFLEDLSLEQSQKELYPQGPSAQFILNHIIECTHTLLQAMQVQSSSDLPSSWTEQLNHFKSLNLQFNDSLEGLSEHDLISGPTLELHPEFKKQDTTLEKLIEGHISHLIHHNGQLASIRNQLNLVWPVPKAIKERKVPKRPKKKALLFWGTGSDVGKSVITAAFCQLLKQKGLKVCPFKAQNMSNNVFVEANGLEVARAQAFQAQASGLSPDARMSPILLKPEAHSKCQVLLNGRSHGSMNWSDIRSFKERERSSIFKSYEELSEYSDIMLIEGAGSPAEVNLQKEDLANLTIANYSDAKSILIGDIHRGGVFASFAGTVLSLSPELKQRCLGVIINRYIGDPKLLEPGAQWLEQKSRLKTLGTLPYINDFNLPLEDQYLWGTTQYQSATEIQIAIIKTPHASNTTDFQAFENEPGVSLHVIEQPNSLDYDAIVIPGSKHVHEDYNFLNQKGWKDFLIQKSKNKSTEIVGICGGFMMMGQNIKDPHAIENNTDFNGLGLLQLNFEYLPNKKLSLIKTVHKESQIECSGYEVHHSRLTDSSQENSLFNDNSLGFGHSLCWGTWLHGLFENDSFRHYWINSLRKRKGLPQQKGVAYEPLVALNQLTEEIKKNIDIDDLLNRL